VGESEGLEGDGDFCVKKEGVGGRAGTVGIQQGDGTAGEDGVEASLETMDSSSFVG